MPENLTLDPPEAQAISQASAKRRREFAAGRWLARTALRQLGFSDTPLLIGSDRAPVWPAGAVGSISHTDDYCVAVVGTNPPYGSLGVDIEPATELEDALWSQICTDGELDWLDRQSEPDRGMLCHVLFVIKECTYKYQAPISRTLLEFRDVEVTVDPSRTTFSTEFVRDGVPGFPRGTTLVGRVLVSDGLILAGIH